MKRRERYNWHLDGTMAVVGVLYILFGMSGFIFFGKDTKVPSYLFYCYWNSFSFFFFSFI